MDRLITVFGGGGFLGRYVVQELLTTGVRVRVASRNPKSAWFLKPLGALGQTQFVATDLGRAESVATAVRGSTGVVNLVGVLAGDFERLHVDGARNVAQAAAATGADALVHVSAIGADASAAEGYARSKGAGEAAVRDAFAAATIVRPSIVFGPEDDFVNRFARLAQKLPILPVIAPHTRFQPVFVSDVARAIAIAALDPLRHGGQTYSLGGPEVLTMRALNEWIAGAIGRSPVFIDVPDAVAGILARIGGFVPGAPLTSDQWRMLQHDNVVPDGAPGLATLGIDAVPLATAAPRWLVRYRRNGRFAVARAHG
jgi:NADH dehydrogenase